jgi:hypothetical protein
VLYAEGLKDVYDLLRSEGIAAARAECDSVRTQVTEAAAVLHDPELDEIVGLLTAYCGSLETRHEPW